VAVIFLSPEALAEYDRDGFCILEGFLDNATCATLQRRAAQLVDDFELADAGLPSIFTTIDQSRSSDQYFLGSGDRVRFFFEEEAVSEGELTKDKARSVNKIGHALHELDPTFAAVAADPRFGAMARDLGLVDPAWVQSMYIFKHPGIGGEVVWHTDHTFLWTDPQTVTGFWVALEDATTDNACLWALPGGHRLPPKRRFHREADGTAFEPLDETPYDTESEVALEVKAGTLVVLHGHLPHRSPVNRSRRSRQAFTFHAIERTARYLDDNWLQRERPWPPI